MYKLPWRSSAKLQIVVSITPDNLNLDEPFCYVCEDENNLSGVILKFSGLGYFLLSSFILSRP
jgi:hypothetical protein